VAKLQTCVKGVGSRYTKVPSAGRSSYLAATERFNVNTVRTPQLGAIGERLGAASDSFKAAFLVVRVEASIGLGTAAIVGRASSSTLAGAATAWQPRDQQRRRPH